MDGVRPLSKINDRGRSIRTQTWSQCSETSDLSQANASKPATPSACPAKRSNRWTRAMRCGPKLCDYIVPTMCGMFAPCGVCEFLPEFAFSDGFRNVIWIHKLATLGTVLGLFGRWVGLNVWPRTAEWKHSFERVWLRQKLPFVIDNVHCI